MGVIAAALALTFATVPDPIRAGFAYSLVGCGYVPQSAVYVHAYEHGERYLEFAYGTPTDAAGCFATPPAAWVWGAGPFDIEVWQARVGHARLHRVLMTEVDVIE